MTPASEAGILGAGEEPSRAASLASPGRSTVLLMGNPNVGKTSLFNHLAKRDERVGNYPGVTVERRSASLSLPGGRTIEIADVPGAYSLSARSREEQVALEAALGWGLNPAVSLVVLVVDAGQLLRNLYLAVQLAELQIPMVIALNLVDEAGAEAPSPEALSSALGVPCIATNGRTGLGVETLKTAIEAALDEPPRARVSVDYPRELVRDVDAVALALPDAWRRNVERDRALSTWALSSLERDDELSGIPESLRQRCVEVFESSGRDVDREIVESRYRFLEAAVKQALPATPRPRGPSLTERVDRVMLHPVFGFAIFVLIMFTVFQSLFAGADPLIGLIEAGVGALQGVCIEWLPAGVLTDLLVEGVVGGVGNVVVFLPQIMMLFVFIGLMEDSGYMARVAYLMDRALRTVGLHGRAFVPMMSGFACAVPAIMATRTMERRRDQMLTMMVVPLMSCSARLPVYTLIIAALFPPSVVLGFLPVQGLLMVAMYVFSTVVALAAAAVLGRTLIRGRSVPLILELPPYRMPALRSVLRMTLRSGRSFLSEAGSKILVFTVLMWGLLSFPRSEPPAAESPPAPVAASHAEASEPTARPETGAASRIEQSYGGQLGKLLEPVLEPLGFDWKIGIGIVGSFAAREVFVSTLGLVYGLDDLDESELSPLRERMREEARSDGSLVYTPLTGLSLMIFFALACQCMSTLAVVRRETRSWRWPAFLFGYMTILAWVVSFVVYQGGRALGL